MPIKINLMTEALAEEDMRRRDPVKQALYLGAFLVVLTLVWFSSTWLQGQLKQSNFDQIQGQIQTQTNAYARVQADFRSMSDVKRRLNALAELHTNRFLLGNLMNALQKIYVQHVQLTRLRLSQTYVLTQAKKAKNGHPGKPATSTEKILLTLDAKDSSPNPGDQVNNFKRAVAESPYFKTHLQPNNAIRLTNLSPAQSNGQGKPFVLFTLECHYPDVTR